MAPRIRPGDLPVIVPHGVTIDATAITIPHTQLTRPTPAQTKQKNIRRNAKEKAQTANQQSPHHLQAEIIPPATADHSASSATTIPANATSTGGNGTNGEGGNGTHLTSSVLTRTRDRNGKELLGGAKPDAFAKHMVPYQWKKGQSGNPGGKGTYRSEIRALCKANTPATMMRVIAIALNSTDERAAIVAAQEVHNRALGPYTAEEPEDTTRQRPDLSTLPDGDLAELRRLMRKLVMGQAAEPKDDDDDDE